MTCLTVIPGWMLDSCTGLSDSAIAALLSSSFASPGVPPAVSVHSPSVPCSGFPVLLSLDAVIPKCRKTLPQSWSEQLSTLEWFKSPDWKKEVIESLDLTLRSVPSNIILTGATTCALFEAMEGTIGPYECVEIYVDGATAFSSAAWSVIVVVHAGNSARLLGTLAGPVILGDQHEAWIGAHTTDNIAAELHALAAALALSIQVDFSCPVVVRPDLSLSRLIGQELVTTVSNPVLAKLCRVLASWAPPNLSFQEVRGHTHQPWNDLADSIAKHVLMHPEDSPAVSFGRLHALARECHDIEWMWVQNLPFPMLHCFPNLVDNSIWQFPPSLRKVATPAAEVAMPAEPMRFHCQMATINVLALDKIDGQNEVGRRTGARTVRLDHQLNAAQFHLVGLQETRTIAGSFQTDHYILLSSGCVGPAAARFGCELWLHRFLPILKTHDGQVVTFSDCTRIVKHADPRRLFVKLEHKHFAIMAVVLHAPCLGKAAGDATAPIDVVKTWWEETSVLWHQMVDTDMVAVFADANATLATTCTEFFQDHDADTTTAQSLVFEEFLVDHALFVPSTFASHHVGPSFTWTHSNGRRMRLDYVLLSRKLFEMVAKSSTWTTYDGTFTHEDHIPACIELAGWLTCETHQTKVRWDDMALLNPQRCQAFQMALSTLPIPTWEVSIDSHCTIFETQYMQLAKQFFTRKKGERSRPPLKADTLDAIAFKQHILDCGRSMQLMTDPDFKIELKAIEKHVRKLVARDLREFYDQILVHLQEAGHLSDHKQMFRMLGRLGGKKHKMKLSARPLPMLKTPDGAPVQSFAQQQTLWMEQFSKIEAGLHISWQALQKSDSAGLGLPMDMQEAGLFPTDWQLQAAVATLKRGKAPGPNGLTPCLLKAGGSVFTKQLATITSKAVAHGKEPTSWKGGRLAPLFKGRGSPADPAAYRAIYISDYTSKVYHKMLRQQLEISWTRRMDLLQLGGRKSMGTDLAHHLLETHQFWCRSKKIPSAIVFFDLRAAFYSVLRQALIATEMDPTALIAALTRMGLPSDVISEWLQQASADHAVLDASPHLEKLIQDCMTNTFFSIDGVPGVCKTTRGTRPGDPLGDLLFNLIMRLVLHDTHAYVQAHSDASWIGQAEHCSSFAASEDIPGRAYCDVSFVDDAAVAIHSTTLADLEALICVVVEGFHHAAASRGLHINFEKGKTEVMWDILGKGSRSLKERLHDAGNRLCWQHHESCFCLRVSHSYKHLGSWMQVAGSHQRELAHRAGQALQSWGCLARTFYQKSYVGLRAKTIAFQSLSMSRMMFHAHTWTGVTDEMLGHWQQKLRKPLV